VCASALRLRSRVFSIGGSLPEVLSELTHSADAVAQIVENVRDGLRETNLSITFCNAHIFSIHTSGAKASVLMNW